MSTTLVTPDTINSIVAFLHYKASKGEYYYPLTVFEGHYDLSDRTECARLAAEMFVLNVEAVKAYYGVDSEKFGPFEFKFSLVTPADTIQTYKTLEYWLYQCCEGGTPETSVLYKLMETLSYRMAAKIVEGLPSYVNATWG